MWGGYDNSEHSVTGDYKFFIVASYSFILRLQQHLLLAEFKICAEFVLQVMNGTEGWNEAWVAGLGTPCKIKLGNDGHN